MRVLIGAVILGLAAPALGQASLKRPDADASQPRQRVVTVFGTDPCPKSTDPDEIVVCSRRPDEERYRIPPGVRSAQAKPPGVTSANRKRLLGDASGGAGGGIGSCSANGPGGGTGCTQQQIDAWREDRTP